MLTQLVAAQHSLAGQAVILCLYSSYRIIGVFAVPVFAVAAVSSAHIVGYCINTTYTEHTARVLEN